MILFNSLSFAAFFAIFFLLYYFVSANHSYKLWLITIASLVFYGSANWRFVPILLGTGLVDFYLAMAIADASDKQRKKRLVTISVAMNLLVLGFFKYTNFFLGAATDGLRLFGVATHIQPLRLIVPLGISFYTFQSISYTLDVYRGNFKPRRRLLEFIASLTFFPHLVAGPIIRSSYLLPQFETFKPPEWTVVRRGFLLIGAGLFKKTIADLLGPIAEGVFNDEPHSMIDSWTGVLAFTGQIYGDFAGYTDIAIGISALLGFNLPQNFNLPYFALGIADFWRRWHISLSSWLRDYCYMPMVLRNRNVPLSLFLTMTLCGLWHGATWAFIVFGAYHGVLVAAEGYLGKKLGAFELPRVIRALLTFYFVMIGFVFFRAGSITTAWKMIRNLHGASALPSSFHPEVLVGLGLAIVALVTCHVLDHLIVNVKRLMDRPLVLWPTAAVATAISFVLGKPGQLFIYFQF